MREPFIANLIGTAPAFQESLRTVHKLAACDVTVLIQGETGTGKELVARAIHYLGARTDHPFIPVNCGAIPDDLAENEFFGHVRGAFTDARDTQPGLVANAEGGTLFLDEIECLSVRAQVVLLRFLQDRVYRPLGGKQQVTGNVRVIAASNADVAELVEARTFRRDLMYRLAVVTLTLPALRHRPGDAALLAEHFVRRFAREYGREEKGLDAASAEMLVRYPWPGNVRELENLVHREFLMSDARELHLQPSTLPAAAPDPGTELPEVPLELGFRRAKALMVAEFERRFVARAMAECRGNVSRAARLAGKDRRAFGKLLKKHGIRGAAFEAGDAG
jgi:DNA-binding NtrC family response regulator